MPTCLAGVELGEELLIIWRLAGPASSAGALVTGRLASSHKSIIDTQATEFSRAQVHGGARTPNWVGRPAGLAPAELAWVLVGLHVRDLLRVRRPGSLVVSSSAGSFACRASVCRPADSSVSCCGNIDD